MTESDYFGDALDGLDEILDENKSGEKDNQDKSKNTSVKASKKTTKKASVKREPVVTTSIVDLITDKKSNTKDETSYYKGIYFDPDVYQVMMELIKKSSKKNIRSQIVNDCLREAFKSRGLL